MLDEAELERILTAGLEAWPRVTVDRTAFRHRLEECLAEGVTLDRLHGEDLVLAFACACADPSALELLEQRWLSQVGAFLARVESSPVVIDDVRQAVRERLFLATERRPRKILEYTGRGALASWLRVVSLRVHADIVRARRSTTALDRGTPPEAVHLSPELALIQARSKAAIDDALRAAFAALGPRDRTIFRLHFVDGVGLDGLANIFGVHRATVARWIASGKEALMRATRRQLQEALRLSPPELESLLRLVVSKIDVSMSELLASGRVAPADTVTRAARPDDKQEERIDRVNSVPTHGTMVLKIP